MSYNLQVQIPQAKTTSLEDLKNVPVTATGGHPVLLRNLATLRTGHAPWGSTNVTTWRAWSASPPIFTARTWAASAARSRRPLRTSALRRPRRAWPCAAKACPCNNCWAVSGPGLLIAVLVIFLLLAANFQSVRLSLVVVSTVPAVIAGVVLMLWLTGTTLNIQSAMGAIMAVGVAVANAILLVTFAERSRIAERRFARRGRRRRPQPLAADPDDQPAR